MTHIHTGNPVQNSGLQSRHQVRFQINASCRFWWCDLSGKMNFAAGKTRNLSSGGVCVVSTVVPFLGAVVMLEIDLPRPGDGETRISSSLLLRAEGTVLRHREREGEFVAMITHATFDNANIAHESEYERIL
jgi:hypothetical protein